jgi:hypothetical protein
MRVIHPETIDTLREHEKAIKANATIDGYGLDAICPTAEFQIFRGECDHSDLSSVYLLGEFAKHTTENTGLARDIITESLSDKAKRTLAYYASITLDARCNESLAPILVAPDPTIGPFIAIDGNHKLIHHVVTHGSLASILPFVCVHHRVLEWGFVPHHARRRV